MILRDVNGGYIYPGQIHDIAVVFAAHTPTLYQKALVSSRDFRYALVAEGKEWDGEESSYFATRYVIGWFTTEEGAETARRNLIASFCPKYQEKPNDVVFAVAWQNSEGG